MKVAIDFTKSKNLRSRSPVSLLLSSAKSKVVFSIFGIHKNEEKYIRENNLKIF